MTEAQLQQAVIDLCDRLGLLVWHDNDSRRNRAGFLDLVIVGARTLFVELKTSKGKLTLEQEIWIKALRDAEDSDAVVWRPEHLRNGDVLRTLKTLATTRPGRTLAEARAQAEIKRRAAKTPR